MTKSSIYAVCLATLTLLATACTHAVLADGEDSNAAEQALEGPESSALVIEWHQNAENAVITSGHNSVIALRDMAIAQVAVYEAVNAIKKNREPYALHLHAPRSASRKAAAVSASYNTLIGLFPAQTADLTTKYNASIATLPNNNRTQRGIEVGQDAAAGILALRAGDGWDAVVPYTPVVEPGKWRPTPTGLAPALLPGWGRVTPFALTSGSQFRAGPPPALDSATHLADLAEVHAYGGVVSARTPEQTNLARFWNASGFRVFNPLGRDLSTSHGLGLAKTARFLALWTMSFQDGIVAAWDTKFTYSQWRPITEIQLTDPTWVPFSTTPNFPDYVSGHSTSGGAAAQMAKRFFHENGPSAPFQIRSNVAPDVTLTYSTYKAMSDGVNDARVLEGIHWRNADLQGAALGIKVANHVFETQLRARNHRGCNEDHDDD